MVVVLSRVIHWSEYINKYICCSFFNFYCHVRKNQNVQNQKENKIEFTNINKDIKNIGLFCSNSSPCYATFRYMLSYTGHLMKRG